MLPAMQAIGELLLELLVRTVLWLLLLPISMLLATPIVLIGAFFTGRPYAESVKDGYHSVYLFWDRVLSWL